MIAGDFVGVSETPEGLQRQIEKALEYTRTWRVTANVKKRALVVCNKYKVNPINFRWKWGEDELPIVPQLVPWRRDLKRLLLGYTYSKSDRKG